MSIRSRVRCSSDNTFVVHDLYLTTKAKNANKVRNSRNEREMRTGSLRIAANNGIFASGQTYYSPQVLNNAVFPNSPSSDRPLPNLAP